LKWWLRTFFENNFDIFCTFVEMCYDERTEMQLKFQHSPNPSVFETTPKVGGTGLTLIVANHAMITQKFWVSNEQEEAFGGVVRLGQNRVPHI
jgi:SNF2 family DNA or RNA helicase